MAAWPGRAATRRRGQAVFQRRHARLQPLQRLRVGRAAAAAGPAGQLHLHDLARHRRRVARPAAAHGVAHPVLQAAEEEVARQRDVQVGAQVATCDAVGQGACHVQRVAPVQAVQRAAEVAVVAARLARQQLQPGRVVDGDLQVPRDQEAQAVGRAFDDGEARFDVGHQFVVERGQHGVQQVALVLEVAVDRAHHAAGPGRDLRDRRLLVGLRQEHLARRGQDLGTPHGLAALRQGGVLSWHLIELGSLSNPTPSDVNDSGELRVDAT
jgi:hypothetical protein